MSFRADKPVKFFACYNLHILITLGIYGSRLCGRNTEGSYNFRSCESTLVQIPPCDALEAAYRLGGVAGVEGFIKEKSLADWIRAHTST